MHLVFQSLNDEKPGFRLALSVAQPENMHHLANKRNLGCRLLSKYDNFGVADVTIRVQEWAHSARSRRLAVSTASIIKKLLRIEDGHLRNLLQNKIRCHFESFHDPFVFNLIAAKISGFLRLSSPIMLRFSRDNACQSRRRARAGLVRSPLLAMSLGLTALRNRAAPCPRRL